MISPNVVPVNLVEAALGAEPDAMCAHANRSGDVIYCHANVNLRCSLVRCTRMGKFCPLYKQRV